LLVGTNQWPADLSLKATREELEWRSQGGSCECPPEKHAEWVYPWIALCRNADLANNHNRENMILEHLSRQLGSEPSRVQVGSNLLVNGNFERRLGGSPESWLAVTAVTFDQNLNQWKRDPDFKPYAGAEGIGLCGGNASIRFGVLWDRHADGIRFSGFSQAVHLAEPGSYVLSACYLLTQGRLEISANQDGEFLALSSSLGSGQTMPTIHTDIQLLQVTRTDLPVHVIVRVYGVGDARIDGIALQPVHVVPSH